MGVFIELLAVVVPGVAIQLCLHVLPGVAFRNYATHLARLPLQEPEQIQHEMVLLLCIVPPNWVLDYNCTVVSIPPACSLVHLCRHCLP